MRKFEIQKYILIFIIIFLILFSFSCKDNKEEIIHHDEYESNIPTEFNGILKEKKLYLTSIGQSPDMNNFLVYLDYLKEEYDIEYVDNTELSARDVEDGSIVFIFVGCSIKALQESGTSVEEEKTRAKDFIKKHDDGLITIVSWHIGGNPRRGATSDIFTDLMLDGSDLFIFVKSGNSDSFLSDTAINKNVPLYEIEKSSSVRTPLFIMLGSN